MPNLNSTRVGEYLVSLRNHSATIGPFKLRVGFSKSCTPLHNKFKIDIKIKQIMFNKEKIKLFSKSYFDLLRLFFLTFIQLQLFIRLLFGLFGGLPLFIFFRCVSFPETAISELCPPCVPPKNGDPNELAYN
ncbi:hypothetical protein BpHYR1_008268 [Brachionus plicatilis]|uniref:Uncharacterized protein n=1 Tax=Brachionus plicatilis TaxID=10195 RepID=A0A3M7STQ4_BRAPC|nr:hypothetical protein BpHYR1_008268 [Brachionus plicatilis]